MSRLFPLSCPLQLYRKHPPSAVHPYSHGWTRCGGLGGSFHAGVAGSGEGLLLTPLLNAVLSRIGEDEVGMASGVLSTAQQVGGALGVALIGVLFLGALPGGSRSDPGAYAHALAVGVGFNVAATVLATALVSALPGTPGSRSSGDPAYASCPMNRPCSSPVPPTG